MPGHAPWAPATVNSVRQRCAEQVLEVVRWQDDEEGMPQRRKNPGQERNGSSTALALAGEQRVSPLALQGLIRCAATVAMETSSVEART